MDYLNKSFKLAVVGSRQFFNYNELKNQVIDFIIKNNLDKNGLLDIVIVSGGAKGADTLAEKLADEMKWGKIIFPANAHVIDTAQACIAFTVGESNGTKNSIERAKKKKILTKVLNYV